MKKAVDNNQPDRYTKSMRKPSKKEISSYAAYLGSIKTEKKAKSSRENGKLGGRPRKNGT